MDRLTKWDEHSESAILTDYDYSEMKDKFLDNVNDVVDCINLQTALDKLAAYEDAEEQGLLLRLPCPIGSEVWKIVNQRDNFSDELHKIVTRVNFRLNMLSEIGKTVFLTREEAEQALEEMKGE